jgi:hypothetical protein
LRVLARHTTHAEARDAGTEKELDEGVERSNVWLAAVSERCWKCGINTAQECLSSTCNLLHTARLPPLRTRQLPEGRFFRPSPSEVQA